MDIRLIAFGMIAVLLLLYIGAKFYIPREKEKSKWEAQYALAAQAYYKENSLSNFNNCQKILLNIFQNDAVKVEQRLARDRISHRR